jgi:hypothetical protein
MGDLLPLNKDEQNEIFAHSEEPLDEAVARLKRHKQRAAEEVYHLGGVLREIRDKELWMLRLNRETGKPAYHGFMEFADVELGISDTYVRRLISINSKFQFEDVKKHGVTKLTFALGLPRPKRQKFLKRAEHVPTNSARIKELVREIREDPAPSAEFIAKTKRVSLDIPLGLRVEPMVARPPDPNMPQEKHLPAKTLVDEPRARFRLSPRVSAYIRISKNERGELMAILEVREGSERTDAPKGIQ